MLSRYFKIEVVRPYCNLLMCRLGDIIQCRKLGTKYEVSNPSLTTWKAVLTSDEMKHFFKTVRDKQNNPIYLP